MPSRCETRIPGVNVPLRKAKDIKPNLDIGTPTWKQTLLEKNGTLDESPTNYIDSEPVLSKKVSQRNGSVDSTCEYRPKFLRCPECAEFEYTRLHRRQKSNLYWRMVWSFVQIIFFPLGIWIYCSEKSYEILHYCSNKECNKDLTNMVADFPSDLVLKDHEAMLRNKTLEPQPI